jgi:hypothetical protein
MLIKILCNKLLLGRATSQLASCTEPSRAGSLFSRARKTGSARARSERRAGLSRVELLRARASSSSSSFFPALTTAQSNIYYSEHFDHESTDKAQSTRSSTFLQYLLHTKTLQFVEQAICYPITKLIHIPIFFTLY